MVFSIPVPRLAAALILVLLYGLMCTAIARREGRRARHARAEAAELASARDGVPPLLVAYASQTGQAEALARETARLLHAAGEPVHLCALFLASTYGEGDAPDNAAGFQGQWMGAAAAPSLAGLQYGLLALGDRQYAHYCGFGRRLDGWLRAQGAVPLFDRVEVDNGSPAALLAWQHQLSQVANLNGAPAWAAPPFADWTLAARRHLNPGSLGAPVFHIELAPPPGTAADWASGDLVQLCAPADPQRPRDYSIASVAGDGRIHLTVRQAVREDGTPGAASGWLCAGLAPGGAVPLRLRAHGPFRLQDNAARPLVLIGNGTGIAGLRSHLRARAPAGAGPNWLVFGERQAAHDFLYRAEIQAWQASGVLTRLYLAFSRDQAQRVHVQDRLAEAADALRAWVADGAAIYVCGSLLGMAQGVHAALCAALGEEAMEGLVRSGRYRRDVY